MEIREVKIEEYWPLIVKNTEEFGQIAVAENDEFNKLAARIYAVLNESFIRDASEYGVSRWEKMLGLAVMDGMTLDDRKVAILNHLSVKTPYTWRVLKQMLTGVLGEGNFEVSLDNDTATLTVGLASTVESMRERVDELFERVIPMNLLVKYDEFPIDYTRVEYVGGTKGAYFSIPEGFDYSDELHSGIELEFVMLKVTGNSSYIWLIGDVPNSGKGHPYIGSGYTDTVKSGMFSNGGAAGLEKVAGKSYSARWNFCDDGLCAIYSGTEGNFADMRSRMESNVKGVTPHAAQNLLAKTGEEYRPAQSSYYAIKRVRFSQNTQVTRDLVAALDETGAPCLYDLISRTPFYNVGSGDFIYPTDSTTYGLRRVLPDWGQLTERGLRRLYHVPAGYAGELYDYAIANGYKPIIETPQPEEGYWVPQWHEREDCIELEWIETEAPMEVIENE